MADIQQNTGGGDGGGSAMTAIVAILVIVILALAVYFGFFRGASAPAGGSDVNVELNTPDLNPGGGSGAAQ